MSSISQSKKNEVHFMVMVALVPETQEAIRQSSLTKDEQNTLIAICHSDVAGGNTLSNLLKKDWDRLAIAVETCFYLHLTEADFETALFGMIRPKDIRYVQQWSTKVLSGLEDFPSLVKVIVDHYPEMREPITKFRTSGVSHYRDRVRNMLAIRRPVIDRLMDQAFGGNKDTDPRRSMANIKPTKITLDGVVVDIPATDEAFAECLSERRPLYSWDGLTTELYTDEYSEVRRRVLFYDRSHG